jgi:hypothetical protein
MSRLKSISQLAEETGFDRRTIAERLGKLDYKKEGRSHLYDSREALPKIYIRDADDDLEKEMALAQLRKERALAEKAEIDVQVRLKELVPIEEVAASVAREYTYVRARILAMPTKLAKPVSMESDPQDVKRILDEAIAEVLEALVADCEYQEGGLDVGSSSEVERDAPVSTEAAAEVKPS